MFIVVGANAWGKGETIKEALKNWKNNLASFMVVCSYNIYSCPSNETYVDDMGYLNYPRNDIPEPIDKGTYHNK